MRGPIASHHRWWDRTIEERRARKKISNAKRYNGEKIELFGVLYIPGTRCGKFYERVKSVTPKKEWNFKQRTKLQQQLGLTLRQFQLVQRMAMRERMGGRNKYHNRYIPLMPRKCEIIAHWLKEVKKRQWYRWERIRFDI